MSKSTDCIYCDADAYVEESHGQWECDFGHRFPVEQASSDHPDVIGEEPGTVAAEPEESRGVRAMYARLAQEHEEFAPTVPDRRGGVAGDLFPLDEPTDG